MKWFRKRSTAPDLFGCYVVILSSRMGDHKRKGMSRDEARDYAREMTKKYDCSATAYDAYGVRIEQE